MTEMDRCLECGAYVENQTKHRTWHEWLNKTIGAEPPMKQAKQPFTMPERLR